MVLLDAIGTLAECLGPKVDTPLFHKEVLSPVIQLWLHCNKRDPLVVAAFEALACICVAIPEGTRLGMIWSVNMKSL